MYNYDFNDEKVIFERRNTFLEIDNKEYVFNLLVTDKNILLFEDINKNNALKGRGVTMLEQYELVQNLPLKNVKYKIENNNTIIGNIIIYNFELDMYIK